MTLTSGGARSEHYREIAEDINNTGLDIKETERDQLRSVKACPEISAIRNVWAAASRAIVQ